MISYMIEKHIKSLNTLQKKNPESFYFLMKKLRSSSPTSPKFVLLQKEFSMSLKPTTDKVKTIIDRYTQAQTAYEFYSTVVRNRERAEEWKAKVDFLSSLILKLTKKGG